MTEDNISQEELKKARRQAINFLYECVKSGLAHSYDTKKRKWVKPYPEVTGYLVSLFSTHHKDLDFATSMATKLISLQKKCGGWCTFYDDAIFTFDTAQIGKGFLDLYLLTNNNEYLEVALNAAQFIASMQISNGSYFPMYNEKKSSRIAYNTSWGNGFSTINSKTNELLVSLNNLGYSNWMDNINKCVTWTISQEQIQYTHPGAYSLEGIIAMGESGFVNERLNTHFKPRLRENGFIAYGPNDNFAYVSGSIQLAILFFKVGMLSECKKIFKWSRNVQNNSHGGLFQFANPDCSLNSQIHPEINSWGVKYYVELIDLLSEAIK